MITAKRNPATTTTHERLLEVDFSLKRREVICPIRQFDACIAGTSFIVGLEMATSHFSKFGHVAISALSHRSLTLWIEESEMGNIAQNGRS
jgi:hypothetical protein